MASKTSVLLFAATFLLLFSPYFSASVSTRKNCVLTENEEQVCDQSTSSSLSTRQSNQPPCARFDFTCWCMKSVDYTNDVRRRHGRTKMFRAGPIQQLNNALQYAVVLSNLGFLKHQVLQDATSKVGCKRWIGGENIAYNYESGGDVAKYCVDQWEKSPGHLENILRDWSDEMVVGVHFARDGRVYCVQTFSSMQQHGTFGNANDPGCDPVSMPTPTPSRKPTPSPSRTPPPTPSAPFEFVEPSPYPIELLAPSPSLSPSATPSASKSKSPSEKKSRKRPSSSRRKRSVYEGNRSCRCIGVGQNCWSSLKEKTGNRCNPFAKASQQPRACKRKCCDYCDRYPDNKVCSVSSVRKICRA